MPPVYISSEDSSAFTVINHEQRPEAPQLPRIVNVVKPLQHDDVRTHLTSAAKEELMDRMTAPAVPNSILDPKFSRALDFKLRRLKEKEILLANLRRPTRYRPRNGILAASNPNISFKDQTSMSKLISQSHPRIDIVPPDCEKSKITPKMEASPSPGRKSRVRYVTLSSEDKPRFVTTVKSGQFLLPPPEVACLLGLETLYPPQEREKIVYSYASKPKAVAMRSKRSLQEKKEESLPNGGATLAAKRPHGAELFSGVRALVAGVVGMRHLVDKQDTGSMAQYSNVMHDKRVVRGSTFSSHPLAAGDGGDSSAARAARTRRRALARRAAAARLRPGTPPPAPGRRHHPIQTEYYLEEVRILLLLTLHYIIHLLKHSRFWLEKEEVSRQEKTREVVRQRRGDGGGRADGPVRGPAGHAHLRARQDRRRRLHADLPGRLVRLRPGGAADPGGVGRQDDGAGAGRGGAGGGAGHAARAAAPLPRAARRRARRAAAPRRLRPASAQREGAARGGGARGAGGGDGGARAGRRRRAGAGLRGRAAARRARRPARPGVPRRAHRERCGGGVDAVAGAGGIGGDRVADDEPRPADGDRARRGGGARRPVPHRRPAGGRDARRAHAA